jgi:hypothetical protein
MGVVCCSSSSCEAEKFFVLIHLVRRTWYSIRPPSISAVNLNEIATLLCEAELALWKRMSRADQSHSVMVLQRFDVLTQGAPANIRAGVLLHDVGKICSNLNTFERIAATVVGPRTKKFRHYHQHEELGRDLLVRAESDALTIETASGEGAWGQLLRRADDI